MGTVNREYKDRLFNFIFGAEENKKWTLSLYNAINRSHYTDPSLIQITTIREVVYLSMHNDVSFLIKNILNLYEQQSAFNPNMPLRQLQYTGIMYEKYITSHEPKMNKFGTKLLRLPVPKLVVFYNGTTEQDDETILRLSDSFPEGADADIEVKVRMININYGHSKEIMAECRPLMEYSWLVDQIRRNADSRGLTQAMNDAINSMPRDFILRPFLIEHRSEVMDMLLTEYNEAEVMDLFWEDGRQDGWNDGRIDLLAQLVKEGSLPLSQGISHSGLSREDFIKQMAALSE